jgi:hypothetical protein
MDYKTENGVKFSFIADGSNTHYALMKTIHFDKMFNFFMWLKKVKEFYRLDARKTRGPWATSLTWETLAHIKYFSNIKYAFHFHLPHPTLRGHDFNRLAFVDVRKLSFQIQLFWLHSS